MSAPARIPGLGKKLGGVFYLHGEDLFRKEEAVRGLIDAHLDPATRDFNLDPLRGTDVDPETLASVIATPPMMAEWRVVVVREVEGLASTKRARDELLRVAQAPPPGLALILSCTVPGGSKAKFYRDLSKHAQSVEFRAITDADAPGWLMARAREEHGIELDVDAARALGAAVGPNLGILAQELAKLVEFVGERRKVSIADVEAAGTKLPSQDRWRWFDMVGLRDFEGARRALPVLLGQGETGVGLALGLAMQLLRLGVLEAEGQRELERLLPGHQKWLARGLARQAKKWTADDLDHALAGLLEVDRLLKASPHSDEHFLESWLLGLRVHMEAA